jgi:5-methylcytosine-specific restriction endonuclease McrA
MSYKHQWYIEHKNLTIERSKLWAKNNPDARREAKEKCRIKTLLHAFELIGKKCAECGSTQNLQFHEIHNKRHPENPWYYVKHFKDFITLCNGCHQKKKNIGLR